MSLKKVEVTVTLNQSELAPINKSILLEALHLTVVNLVGLHLESTLMLIARVSPRKYCQKAEARLQSTYSILILAIIGSY